MATRTSRAITCCQHGRTGGSVTSSVSRFSSAWLTSSGTIPAGRPCAMRGCCCPAFSRRRSSWLHSDESCTGCEVPAERAEGEGELLALRWSALDLEGGALTVRESVFETLALRVSKAPRLLNRMLAQPRDSINAASGLCPRPTRATCTLPLLTDRTSSSLLSVTERRFDEQAD
jgi:hypothetical protein